MLAERRAAKGAQLPDGAAGDGKQRQGQGQPVAEDAQFLMAQFDIQFFRGGILQCLQIALRPRFGLAGIEQGLLLPLDIGQRLALDNLQFIQRLRALDQFAVLLRAPGGVAGRQPVVEGIARRR